MDSGEVIDMAEFRNVHSRIWKDEWVSDLEPEAKLLFIYLFSNERASICGLYELPLKFIVFETGISKDKVLEILAVFEKEKKVYYRDGIVWVKNLRKYNDSGNSPKVLVRIQKDLETIPDCELKNMYFEYYGYPIRVLGIPYLENESETVKETVKETETDTDTEIDTVPKNSSDGRPNIFSIYEREIGPLTPFVAEDLKAAEKDYPIEWIEAAIREAVANNVRKWSYIMGILRRWKKEGLKGRPNNTPPRGKRFKVYTDPSGALVNELGQPVDSKGYLLEVAA
jgi:DnaD/phage-associated family protein